MVIPINNRKGFQMNVFDVFFWIFMVISLILVIWYVFGQGPAEFYTLLSLFITLVFKVSSMNREIGEIKTEIKRLREDVRSLRR